MIEILWNRLKNINKLNKNKKSKMMISQSQLYFFIHNKFSSLQQQIIDSELKMFCDNVSYQTSRINHNSYCPSNENKILPPSYNYLPTEQSERNQSNLHRHEQSLYQNTHKNLAYINQTHTLELQDQNTKHKNKKIQAVQRNNKISTILSTVLAFSQRIQILKEKLCGYPAQNFLPTQFFNVLDLTEKGYVDMYDIKRFVNNEKIRQKDIVALFKRINGDHSKDNTVLSYFGYLNLIKPYFNEHLARDLLLRDTIPSKKANRSIINSAEQKIGNQFIEPTQQSVLLLFQELMLLHCICVSQHEQAKQDLMSEYMLNIVEIREIVGLQKSDFYRKRSQNQQKGSVSPSRITHKSPLSILFNFIQINSQFQIEFKEMKYLLSFLNAHEFSLNNEKHLTTLFMPTNCQGEILRQIQKKKEQLDDLQGAQNYMNTYLTKQNLMNKGNMQVIRNYLNQKARNSLTEQHFKTISRTIGSSKVNFLEFVHPNSIQRIEQNNIIYPPQSLKGDVQLIIPNLQGEHPQFQTNVSNKKLCQNPSGSYQNPQVYPSSRQYSNSSSIPQQNIKVNPPREIKQRYENSFEEGLIKQFYEPNIKEREEDANSSKLSNTPFLEKFMKKSNPIKNNHTKIDKNQESKYTSSMVNQSAFEIVEYGYQPTNTNKINLAAAKSRNFDQYRDESQRFKKQSLDSRYTMIVSQYKNSNPQHQQAQYQQNQNERKQSHRNNLFQINQNQSYSKRIQNIAESKGPKLQKSVSPHIINSRGLMLQQSRGNYIESVGLSQSNMVNDSKFVNNFHENGGNILSQFLKK